MRVRMLVTKSEHIDGVLVTMQKGSQWNVSPEQGDALIAAAEAEADPDVVYEAEESRRAQIRALGEEHGVAADVVEACIADTSCTPEDAFDRFVEASHPAVVSATTEEE